MRTFKIAATGTLLRILFGCSVMAPIAGLFVACSEDVRVSLTLDQYISRCSEWPNLQEILYEEITNSYFSEQASIMIAEMQSIQPPVELVEWHDLSLGATYALRGIADNQPGSSRFPSLFWPVIASFETRHLISEANEAEGRMHYDVFKSLILAGCIMDRYPSLDMLPNPIPPGISVPVGTEIELESIQLKVTKVEQKVLVKIDLDIIDHITGTNEFNPYTYLLYDSKGRSYESYRGHGAYSETVPIAMAVIYFDIPEETKLEYLEIKSPSESERNILIDIRHVNVHSRFAMLDEIIDIDGSTIALNNMSSKKLVKVHMDQTAGSNDDLQVFIQDARNRLHRSPGVGKRSSSLAGKTIYPVKLTAVFEVPLDVKLTYVLARPNRNSKEVVVSDFLAD